jgi:hypothetical protein
MWFLFFVFVFETWIFITHILCIIYLLFVNYENIFQILILIMPFLYNKMPTNMNIQLSLKQKIQNLKNEHTQNF